MSVRPAVWVNGMRVAPRAPAVRADDRGLLLADGLFETMRARRGVVFRLDQHLARLGRSLDAFGIPEAAGLAAHVQDVVREAMRDVMDDAVGESVHAAAASAPHAAAHARPDRTGEAAVRLTVTRGVGAGVLPPRDARPTVIVAVNPFPQLPPTLRTDGLRAHLASGRRNEHAPSAGHKTLAYTDAVLALAEAHRVGCDDALLLDTAGHCAEASASNLFAVRGDRLVTPPVACGALPGITRAIVLALAPTLGFAVEERVLEPDELQAADEAFLTSALRGIAPLVAVGGAAIGTGRPGEGTRALHAAHAALVRAETDMGA